MLVHQRVLFVISSEPGRRSKFARFELCTGEIHSMVSLAPSTLAWFFIDPCCAKHAFTHAATKKGENGKTD